MNFLDTVKGLIDLWQTKGAGQHGNIYTPGFNTYAPRTFGSAKKQFDANVGWVYNCVTAIAEDLSAHSPILYQVKGEERIPVLGTHTVARRLKSPNPIETGMQFWYRHETHMDLIGNAIIWVLPSMYNSKLISEMYLLNPEYVDMVMGKDDEPMVKAYRYKIGTKEFLIDPAMIIHSKKPNPRDPFWGLSPVQQNSHAVDMDTVAKSHQLHFLESNPQSRMVILTGGPIGKAGREQLRESIKETHTNEAHPFILEGGAGGMMDAKTLSTEKQEVNYLDTRKLTRDEILSIYRIPASIFGITDDVNRSNGENASTVYALRALEPNAAMRDDALQVYFQTHGYINESFVIGHENLIPENEAQQLEEAKVEIIRDEMLLRNAVISIDEYRAKLNIKPLPKGIGTEPTIEANRTRLSLVGQAPAGTPQATKAAEGYVISHFDDTEIKAALAYKAKLLAVHVKATNAMADDLVDYFQMQEDDFFSRVKFTSDWLVKGGNDPLIMQSFDFDSEAYNNALKKLAGDQYEAILPEVWEIAMQEIQSNSAYPLNEAAIERIMQESTAQITKVNESTQKQISEIIKNGLDNDSSIEEIKQAIKDKFETFKTSRCELIATLTVSQTINGGLQESFNRESDIVKGKTWLTVRDGRVRKGKFNHIKADGETVGVNKYFVRTGEELMYPADPKGSIGNIARCRCFSKPELQHKNFTAYINEDGSVLLSCTKECNHD